MSNAKMSRARRVSAGVGVVALAAGLTLSGAGLASAAPVSADGGVRTYKIGGSEEWVDFSRTVDKSSVAQGDIVRITTTLTESNEGTYSDKSRVYNFEDWTPACFVYQEDSGVVDASQISSGGVTVTDRGDHLEAKPSTSAASWRLNRGDHVTLTADYKVDCAPGEVATGGLNAHTSPSSDGANLTSNGWLDERSTGRGAAANPSNLKNVGPTITVTSGVTAPDAITGLAVTPANPTTNQKVTVSGKTSPNTAVTVSVGGNDYPGNSDGSGEFSIETAKLGAGDHTATVTASNTAGTETGTVSFSVTDAPTAPSAPTGITVNPQPIHPGDTVTVAGKAEAGSQVVVTLGGQSCTATANSSGVFSCTVTAPGTGTHQLAIVASNSEGPSDAYTTNVVVSDAPTAGQPDVTIDPTNPQFGQSVTVTVTAPGGEAGKSVSVLVNGDEICQGAVTDANGKASCTMDPTAPGVFEVVVAVDGAESYTTGFTVTEPDTGGPGDGGDDDGDDDTATGSLGSLGFLGSLDLFGSLN